VSPILRRLLILLAVALLAAACAAQRPATVPSPSRGPSQPPSTGMPATPSPTRPAATLPPTGNTGERFPELAVSSGGPGYVVELTDPTAKAWRIVVTGRTPGDRLELLVEVGDIVPGVIVTTVVGGQAVDEHDLTGIVSTPTSAAGGCHPVLQACYSSGGIDIDLDAGRIGLVIEQIEATGLSITGATAGWPDQPFVLGPWRTSETFQTGAAG
jgi:hypothetical protein